MLIQMVVAELEARKQVPAYNGQSRGSFTFSVLYERLSKYGDTKSARTIMLDELKKLIEANPLFRENTNFVKLQGRTRISKPSSWITHVAGCAETRWLPPLGAHVPYQPAPALVLAFFAGWMSNPPTRSHPVVSGEPIVLGAPPIPENNSVKLVLLVAKRSFFATMVVDAVIAIGNDDRLNMVRIK
ncbi:TOPLESS-related 1, partial [Striga asiatica]